MLNQSVRGKLKKESKNPIIIYLYLHIYVPTYHTLQLFFSIVWDILEQYSLLDRILSKFGIYITEGKNYLLSWFFCNLQEFRSSIFKFNWNIILKLLSAPFRYFLKIVIALSQWIQKKNWLTNFTYFIFLHVNCKINRK